MSRRRSHHGIFLVEMLFFIALVAVIFYLEALLFNSSLRTIDAVPHAHARSAQLNQMTTTLGRDVWSAITIELSGQRSVALGQPDGSSIRWDFNDDGRIVRSPSAALGESQQWTVANSPTLQPIGGGLIVKMNSKLFDVTDQRPLFSQMLVLNAENR